MHRRHDSRSRRGRSLIAASAAAVLVSALAATSSPARFVPGPDQLTELTAAQWGAGAQNAEAAVYDDNERVHTGQWSIRFETTAPFDSWAFTPLLRDGDWDLTGTALLRIWVYAENDNAPGFQNNSPWIRLGSQSGYWQYQTDHEYLNGARDNWLLISIPIAGSDLWRRTTAGTVDLTNVDYLEFHADTWGDSFILWFDGIEFVPQQGPLPGPAEVRVDGHVTTAHVNWEAVEGAGIAGYQVERRLPGGTFSVVKRVLARTSFTDCLLSPGQTYEYRVLGIGGDGTPLMQYSPVSSGATDMDPSTISRHKNMEIVFAFYTAGYTQQQIDRLTAGVEKGIEFYWRTSATRLNLDPTWLYIDAPLPASQWGPEVENDLRNRGVENHQYDLAYLIGNGLAGCLGGYLVFGSTCASIGTSCGVPYPENMTGVDYTIAWTFTHEIHHALELMENITGPGTPEVLFCHFPWCYPDPLGPTGWHMDWGAHYDGIALTNRDYGDSWMTFPAPYDGVIECVDADQDGLPDSDARIPQDETRFGSRTDLADSDGDGLSDLEEYCRYNFRGTDPLLADTDGDGIPDGLDHEPLYAVSAWLPRVASAPLIDGVIEEGWPILTPGYYFTQNATSFTLNTYAGYDYTALFLAFESSRKLRFMVSIDGSGQDGRFESPVRHVEGATDTGNSNNKHHHIGDSWGDGHHIHFAHGLNTIEVYGRSVIGGAQVASTLEGGIYRTEVRIPATLPGGAAYTWYPPGSQAPVVNGLRLTPGQVIGLNVTFSNFEGSGPSEFSGTWTSLFETHSYVDFVLAQTTSAPEAPVGGSDPGLYLGNPYRRGTEIVLRVAAPSQEAEAAIFDLLGRRVRTLYSGPAESGELRLRWDGVNESGREAAAGVYYLRATDGRSRFQRKLVLL